MLSNLFQDIRTWISAPAALNLSAEMQRGGKWWSETPRLEFWRVAPLGAECAAPLFCWDRSDWCLRVEPMHTGLTGGMHRSDRWCQAGPLGAVYYSLFLGTNSSFNSWKTCTSSRYLNPGCKIIVFEVGL